MSLSNVNPNKKIVVNVELRGVDSFSNVNGEIITSSAMNDYNDFGKAEKVNIKSFSDFKLKNKCVKISLPSKSVVTLEID